MIDAKQMKNAPDGTHTLAPPFEIVRAHPVSAIKRNTPVFPAFLGKLVVLEVVFGRRAAGPVEREFIGARENVSAVITDPKGNIAHQRNSPSFGIRFDLAPLLMGCPLHITEEILALPYRCLSILRQIAQPGADLFNRLMFGWPSGPGRALLILLHQNPEKCVIVQPGGFLFAKFSKLQPALCSSALTEIRSRV